jgi:hypothetical protein
MKPVKQFSGCQVCWPISSHGFVRFLTWDRHFLRASEDMVGWH